MSNTSKRLTIRTRNYLLEFVVGRTIAEIILEVIAKRFEVTVTITMRVTMQTPLTHLLCNCCA